MTEAETNKAYMSPCNVMMVSSPYKNIIKYDDAEGLEATKGNIPNLEHKGFNILGSNLYRVLEAIKKIKTESVVFEIYQGIFSISTKDDLGLKTKFIIDITGQLQKEVLQDFSFKSKYSFEYFKAFFKNFNKSSFDQIVGIGFGDDYPIKISIGNEWFILAPRVTND